MEKDRSFFEWYDREMRQPTQRKGKKTFEKRKSPHKKSMDSLNKSESVDEEMILKDKEQFKSGKGKFHLYNKYLNVLLLKTGDPFVAEMYNKYLKAKRRGRKQKADRNFYERMQLDIKKRT